MKFGEVDIGTTGLEGAILAHTLRLGNGGGAVKKGKVLSTEDVERLRRAGYRSVMVARLEAGDVAEDVAAKRLATMFEGATVRASDASTGRCNLYSRVSGLVFLDKERIDVANRFTEAITIATLPPYALVSPNTMVATVKIIPFGVPERQVIRWEELFASRESLRVAELERFDAGLVLTELPGVRHSLLERASRAQRARLGALGSQVRREIRCEHTIEAAARAIRTLDEEGCNPILLLGASAIVDRGDVIPSALVRAGGEVSHLGMPVDPGNLLMVGSLGSSAVFGLPGCARSLTSSGFDQVLRRFFIGDEIDSDVISGLGVGGLLKETPERPMPRDLSAPSRGGSHIAGVVLAAGASERMGKTNKLTLEVEGAPMVARVVDALRNSGVDDIVVVTGYEREAIEQALGDRSVRYVHNPDFAQGMGTSVRAGIEALNEDVDGALIALGDMPWVGKDVIGRLVEAFSPGGELSIYIPMFGRKRGNPVLWAARHFAELRQLSGDVGGKALFHQHDDAICYVDVKTAAINIDVDTPENLHELGIDGDASD